MENAEPIGVSLPKPDRKWVDKLLPKLYIYSSGLWIREGTNEVVLQESPGYRALFCFRWLCGGRGEERRDVPLHEQQQRGSE